MKNNLFFGSALFVLVGLATGPLCQTTLVAEPTVAETAPVTAERAGLSVSLNFVNLGKDARVVGISKASTLGNVQNMKTGSPEAAYTFDPADPAPTLVVDLGSHQAVSRVNCAYKAPAGRLDLYLVDDPKARDGGTVSLNYVTTPTVQAVSNDGEKATRKPVYSLTTAGEPSVSKLSAELGGQSGRYLIAEFHPLSGQHRVAHRDGKDFKDAKDLKDAAAADAPVAGIASFGDPSASQAVPLLPPASTTLARQVSP